MELLSKKSLYLHRCSNKDNDIEESCLALNRLRIWKIQCVRAKGLKAVPLQSHIYSPLHLGRRLIYIPAGVSRFFHSDVHRYSRTFRQRMS